MVGLALIIPIFTILIAGCIESQNNVEYGPYKKTINREYSNQTELELILFCENITPEDNNPWYDEFDNVKLADTVCNETIQYYSDLIDIIEEDHDYTGFDIKNAQMDYHAELKYISNNGEYNSTDEVLVIVNLTLDFEYYVGNLNALWYDHYRTVILTEDFEIIEILGDDEKRSVIVS
jgi:hypothetical protein